MTVHWTELVVFTLLFVFVTVLGFYAVRWKVGASLDHLDEWGLGRWFHRWGLLAGWATGQAWGLSLLYNLPNPVTGAAHFGNWTLELGTLSILGWEPFGGSQVQIYIGFIALAGNLVVAALVTVVLQQLRVFNGTDETEMQDYHVDEDSPRLKPVAGVLSQTTSI